MTGEVFLCGAGLFCRVNAVSFGSLSPWYFKVGFGFCKIIIVLVQNTQLCQVISGGWYFFKTGIVRFHRINPEVLKISISL